MSGARARGRYAAAVMVLAQIGASAGCRGGSDARRDAGADGDARGDAVTGADAALLSEMRVSMGAARVAGVGFAAVVKEREEIAGGVGRANEARAEDATAETIFEAASIAKLVVATCVMQLVEEGRLELDADVSRYVGFTVRHPSDGGARARPEAAITVRRLLTHTASIRDRNDEIGVGAEGHPLGTFLRGYLASGDGPRAAAFLEHPPGTRTVYSNVGAALAAYAVERVAGEGFAEVSRRRVFVPLAMRRTSWTAPPPGSAGAATPYAYRDGRFVALPPPSHAVYPAVDLHASARDLGRFARAILRGGELDGQRILAPASVDAMLRSADARGSRDAGDARGPRDAGDARGPRDAGDAGDAQALGWQLRVIDGAHVAGHEGEDAGATTGLFVDPARGIGAVVLANGDAFPSGDRTRAAAVESMLSRLLARAGDRSRR